MARPVVVIDVEPLGDLDIVDVGVLVRLQLLARRFGASVELCNARDELTRLLALVGLGELLPLRVKGSDGRVGQAEVREELGIDEEVDPVDPAV